MNVLDVFVVAITSSVEYKLVSNERYERIKERAL